MFSSSADLNLCKLLAKPLHKLSLASTGAAAAYCSDRLAQIHQSHIRRSKSFPSIKSVSHMANRQRFITIYNIFVGQLMFLKLLGALFPASDYAHQVTTPAFIVLGEILAEVSLIRCRVSLWQQCALIKQCSIKSTSDALLSLYTCSTVLEVMTYRQRFMNAWASLA